MGYNGTMARAERINLKQIGNQALEALLEDLRMPRYRRVQILQWIYQKGVTAFEDMSNLSRGDRAALAQVAEIPALALAHHQVSRDGTEKFLFRLRDGLGVESVLIPDGRRLTLCVSTQVGCAMGCRFCLTGVGGLKRHLEAHEIVDQVLQVQRHLPRGRRITHLVYMGMGEPLDNLDQVILSLQHLTDPLRLGYSAGRITVSTVGLPLAMARLGEAGLGVNLAVSLNAASDATRNRIMPINRRHGIASLLAACQRYPLKPRQRLTVAYVLLEGVNDSREEARRLIRLLRGIRCKVNLIPFNPYPGSVFRRPDPEAVAAFQKTLRAANLDVFLRVPRGEDILAACGQLRDALSGASPSG